MGTHIPAVPAADRKVGFGVARPVPDQSPISGAVRKLSDTFGVAGWVPTDKAEEAASESSIHTVYTGTLAALLSHGKRRMPGKEKREGERSICLGRTRFGDIVLACNHPATAIVGQSTLQAWHRASNHRKQFIEKYSWCLGNSGAGR